MEGSAFVLGVIGVLVLAVIGLAAAVLGLVVAATRSRTSPPAFGPPSAGGPLSSAAPPPLWQVPPAVETAASRPAPRVNRYGELED